MEGRLIGTSLTHDQRKNFRLETGRWENLSSACLTLRNILDDLLADWGAFLDITLYREALIHFLGGETEVLQRLEIVKSDTLLGSQLFSVHYPGVAFYLTGLSNPDDLSPHLHRLLSHTRLNALQWINFSGRTIQMETLRHQS